MRVLVLNPGSSSLKGSVVGPGDDTIATDQVGWGADATARTDRAAGVSRLIASLSGGAGVDAVGYRVVHGGERFRQPVVVDDGVVEAIEELSGIAPLHNAVAAETIRAARAELPELPHVACFDTAFHRTLAEEAWRYPLPDAWVERHGLRRYGFHGLSVEWSVGRAAALLGRPIAELRLVVAHLGSGASVTAVSGGRTVDTSMGFTPLEGLMMGSRAGSVDPGILLHLLRAGMPLDELADGLDHRSGLVAVSGSTGGAREIEASAGAGDARARLAIDMFSRRAASGIAGMASALDRLDGIVFTGGIGENSATMRAAITERLAVLGVEPARGAATADAILSEADAPVAVLRVEAREDVVIARSVRDLVEHG